MEKLNQIKSRIVPLFVDNVDTDQIIPARFLKSTNKDGFGKNLFYDWRFDENGQTKESFPLNSNEYAGSILIAGQNFGCGSSREHAAWALKDYGFNVIISTEFADIFKGNALNNGILPIEVSEEFYEDLKEEIELDNETKLDVDLEQQEVRLVVSGQKEKFKINSHKKNCLIKGEDDIDYLIGLRNRIEKFEKENYEI